MKKVKRKFKTGQKVKCVATVNRFALIGINKENAREIVRLPFFKIRAQDGLWNGTPKYDGKPSYVIDFAAPFSLPECFLEAVK